MTPTEPDGQPWPFGNGREVARNPMSGKDVEQLVISETVEPDDEAKTVPLTPTHTRPDVTTPRSGTSSSTTKGQS